MGKLIDVLKIVLAILPSVIAAIKAIEEAIPGAGKGEQKLAAVRAVIESGFEYASEGLVKFENVWPVIEKTVGALVDLFNKTGVFNRG